MKRKVLTVLGTRPEIVKLSPLLPLLERNFRHKVIFTRQHYSPELGGKIWREFGLRSPDFLLPLSKEDFSVQFGVHLKALDKILKEEKPDFVIVQGDTNSALLGALAGARRGICVAHIEAGCRSRNILAPEEQNRKMIDSVATLFFTADKEARENLRKEGHKKHIYLVGSTGVDAIHLAANRMRAPAFPLPKEPFALATLHRQENTQSLHEIRNKIALLEWVAKEVPVLFPIHPRTKRVLTENKIRQSENIQLLSPLGYHEFLFTLNQAHIVLSDSGGIQEEAAVLGTPCLILREETEWKRLVLAGKNFLIPHLTPSGKRLIKKLLSNQTFYRNIAKRKAPGLAPGASQKIAAALKKF